MLTAKLGFQPLLPSRCYRSFHHAVHRTTRSVRSLAIGVGDFYYNKVELFIWLIEVLLRGASYWYIRRSSVFKIRRRLTMIALVSGFIVAMLALRTGDDLDLPFKDIPVNKQPSFFFCWFIFLKKLQQCNIHHVWHHLPTDDASTHDLTLLLLII